MSIIIFHTILTIIVIVVIIYSMVALNYDLSDYRKYLDTTEILMGNQSLADLLNANTVGNLPGINISTNNVLVNQLQNCREGPIFIGKEGSEFICRNLCGANGRVFEVGVNDEIFINNEKLRAGVWCTLDIPRCNLNTTFAVGTVNGVVCNSRFPRVFGGREGNEIIACNNSKYFSTDNVLWDNLRNMRVTEFTRFDTNEDDLLPDGNFRYACRFGDDAQGNRYIAHFGDRLHPMMNYCSASILEASRSIVMRDDASCDCGDFNQTRVKNWLSHDRFTHCTNCYIEYDSQNERAKIGSECFTLRSPYNFSFEYPPCLPSRIRTDANFCEPMSISITEEKQSVAFPFHPLTFRGIREECQMYEWGNV